MPKFNKKYLKMFPIPLLTMDLDESQKVFSGASEWEVFKQIGEQILQTFQSPDRIE